MNKLKTKVRSFINTSIEKTPFFDPRWSPETKASLLALFLHYQSLANKEEFVDLKNTGLKVFSQFEEDGILLAIMATINEKNKIFVDLGAGNGINSNCANLAVNFGWHGLFIDGNKEQCSEGEEFYSKNPNTWLFPPRFKNAFIQRENINALIKDEGFKGDIGLLSIDLDGNDYWVWEALEVVKPTVVIIETHVEFGMNSIVVPYDKDYYYPGKHPHYHGASPVAMNKLANKLGYRLVGANSYGFNTIYVKNGIAENLLPEVSVESILGHPRNKERFKLFDEIKDWEYVSI